MKTATIGQFLSRVEADLAMFYVATNPDTAVDRIEAELIRPHLPAINAALGQENDARYIAYAVVYAIQKGQE